MSAARSSVEIPQSAPVPRLLWELPSRPRVFFGNLRDIVFPHRPAPLELTSTPGEFWPDVLVRRGLPWNRFLQSGFYHLIAGGILIGLTHLFALQPRVVPERAFDHSQVIYYRASEYLPPLDTRDEPDARPRNADPEFSRQPIISVPPEADNREQTIVTPPSFKLRTHVAMPNIVAWSDAEKPHLAVPPAPLTPAADITRIAPSLESSVVKPPPVADLPHSRVSPALQNSVAAPPAELRASNAGFQGLQPNLLAPPSNLNSAATRPLGQLDISPSAVIAPAPQLPVATQRSVSGGGPVVAGGPQVAPPPSSLSGSESSSFGSRGRVIALNLHPSVEAPHDLPAGNRRGMFAATPEGHPGASGSPGARSKEGGTGSLSSGGSKGNGDGSGRKAVRDLPAGLYVGNSDAKTPMAGDPAGKAPASQIDPNLVASVHPPRVATSRPLQPESAAKLSEPERAVFGGRRFYSVTLNMPNLNSAGGGSWVIRFAELNHESGPQEASALQAAISQPMATRKVDPAYPIQLMRENVAGTVILYAVIHADGTVGNVRVLRGVDDRLDRFASEAVAQWKFDPATKNGAPVDVEATFQIPFRPSRTGTSF